MILGAAMGIARIETVQEQCICCREEENVQSKIGEIQATEAPHYITEVHSGFQTVCLNILGSPDHL